MSNATPHSFLSIHCKHENIIPCARLSERSNKWRNSLTTVSICSHICVAVYESKIIYVCPKQKWALYTPWILNIWFLPLWYLPTQVEERWSTCDRLSSSGLCALGLSRKESLTKIMRWITPAHWFWHRMMMSRVYSRKSLSIYKNSFFFMFNKTYQVQLLFVSITTSILSYR